ncbi:MAG: DUF692 domain-containing protein [Brachymonas sp.]
MKSRAPVAAPHRINRAGIGWRHPHYATLLEQRPALGFLQVHSENFFGHCSPVGGAALATLQTAREHYPISLHGVGLSLGSGLGIDPWHLDQLESLVQRIEPVCVSDHACFARGINSDGTLVHASDLLPIPFTHESLDAICANVSLVQDRLKRRLLVENLSAYLSYAQADFSEEQFLTELVQRTGCQLLLDVNNVFVNAMNLQSATQRDRETAMHIAREFLNGLPTNAIGEMHVAGHCEMETIVIDDHGCEVCAEVWQLYAYAVQRFGDAPALIEWDTHTPALDVLLAHAAKADQVAEEALSALATSGASEALT